MEVRRNSIGGFGVPGLTVGVQAASTSVLFASLARADSGDHADGCGRLLHGDITDPLDAASVTETAGEHRRGRVRCR